MPLSFYKNRNDLRPAMVHSSGYIENQDTDCTNLVQIQESVPSRETIPSISITHSVSKRNWATYRLPANGLLPRIGLSIAVEVSVVVRKKSTSRNSRARVIRKRLRLRLLRFSALVAGVSLLAAPMRSQTQLPEWQAEVRKYAEARDWISAMKIVDRQAAAAPQNMDVRAWRARVLSWP